VRSPSPKHGPDFICIGPHKTGTNWLFKCLERHQQVYNPATKEINYFYYKYTQQFGIKATLNYRKEFTKNFFNRKLLKLSWIRYKNAQSEIDRKRALQKLFRDLRIISGTFNEKFYRSLFAEKNNKISGDISPMYFRINAKIQKHISESYPDLRLLIFLREPADRLWSNIKMNLFLRNLKATDKNIAILFKEQLDAHQNYPFPNLKSWMRHFKKENIFIGFYDELIDTPVLYFKKICRFLNLSEDLDSYFDFQNPIKANTKNEQHFSSPEEYIGQRFNKTKLDMRMPENLRKQIYSTFYPQIEELQYFLDSPYPNQWLNLYNKVLLKNV